MTDRPDRSVQGVSHLAGLAFAAAALACGLALVGPVRAEPAPEADGLTPACGVRGGLVIHLGCGQGQGTAAMPAGEAYIVQGLDVSQEKVSAAMRRFHDAGLGGAVSARVFDGRALPFVDNTVNLLVVDDAFSVPREEMLRVLCPRGTLCLRTAGQTQTLTKPWPAGMDEWTHYQHDPQGTMVGEDRLVGPPKGIQWLGDPKWLRNHDFMSSMNAMVSAGGRVFYIIDEGLRAHVFLPAHWVLAARDAFNGTLLWKRPLTDWHPTNWPLKSGPGDLPRRLVAVGDRVYATLGFAQPVTAIDAATGRTVRTYEDTRSTDEILCDGGVLYLLVEPDKPAVNYRAQTATYSEIARANTGWGWTKDSPPRSVVAVEAQTGKVLWRQKDRIAPLTLTVGGAGVYYFNGESMVALDRASGKRLWTSPAAPKLVIRPATGTDPRVVFSDGVLILCHATQTYGFSAADGKLLWQGRTQPSGHHCPNDLFVIGGQIWSAHTGAAQKGGTHFTALDLRTGATAKDLVAANLPAFPMHPRCYPSRATERYIMTAGIGTEFYHPGDSRVDIHNYVRGSCIYGVMPCNGLLYKPPDSCACYYMSKLEYFCALAPAGGEAAAPVADADRLVKGPAYADSAGPGSPASAASAKDWPMYRHDATRSGAGGSSMPGALKKSWQVALGGKLTQPVIAGGRVYVASVDSHALYALDAANGRTVWTFVAGGRIDSPPTIRAGTVLLGSADGWVYCLRASDAALAWRYLVAPDTRQIVSYQQLESLWPLSGSVLVVGQTVYALAGRNMFFDGGMRLTRLDASTGRMISCTVLNDRDPHTGKSLQDLIVGKSMPVANPDVLSCDGRHVYMGAQRFDLEGKRLEIASISSRSANPPPDSKHLFCPTGFLDDSWFHRTYWTYGENFPEGWSEYNIAQKRTPCGRIMVLGGSRAYGFRSDKLGNTLLPRPEYRLYAADTVLKAGGAGEGSGSVPTASPAGGRAGKKAKADRAAGKAGKLASPNVAGGYKVYWEMESPPLLVNAMALAGESLFIAGPPDVADESKMLGFLPGAHDEINRSLQAQEDAWNGKKGALLWAVAARDGARLGEYKLDAVPVWDGLAVAEGCLFVSMQNGELACWAGR